MRTCRGIAVTSAGFALAAIAGATIAAPGPAAWAGSTTPLAGSVSPAVRAGARLGAVPVAQQLTVQVWLMPEVTGATRFANAVATPGSPQFHRYLSPAAYTARFGPSAGHVAAITSWLTGAGLSQVHTSNGRDYISATGPVSTVQSAFGVHLDRYRANGAVIQANDRAVSVPTALAPAVLGVTGLSSFKGATAARQPACSRYWAQHVHALHPSYKGLTKAALPACGYSANQIRAAYGANWAYTGKSQTVALTEDETPTAMFRTLTEYAKSNHLPAPKSSQFREVHADGGGKCAATARDSASYEDEAEMDSEAVYAMAPRATQLMVIGGGCDEDQALLNAASAVLTGDGGHPSASIVSNSWQIPLGEVPAQTVHAIDLRAAAEGVGMYFSSGDTPGLTTTASDPYATAVGGTTLGIGASNNRVFETGWSNDTGTLEGGTWTDVGINGAAGGGTSLVYPQPRYQKGVVPTSMSDARIGKRIAINRAVPDIAADADLDTGMLTGYTDSDGHYQTQVNAGTSLASPLIAGLVADAQQGQRTPFGFINPLIYRLAGTPAFHDVLPVDTAMPQQNRAAYMAADDTYPPSVDVFDSQAHSDTDQVTAKGYDTMTGVGTPNGAVFITELRRAGDVAPFAPARR